MEPDVVLNIIQDALLLTLLLSGPPVLAALVVGLIVSLFQAATQIQEQTLTFVPKLLAVFGVLAIMGLWLIQEITQFATTLYDSIPELIY